MAKIDKRLGDGGRGVSYEGGAAPLVEILEGIADDLAAGTAATTAAADAVAAVGDPPTKAEFDAVVTLVNEIKTKLNAVAATSLKTTKDV
jgi:hypothetical protein